MGVSTKGTLSKINFLYGDWQTPLVQAIKTGFSKPYVSNASLVVNGIYHGDRVDFDGQEITTSAIVQMTFDGSTLRLMTKNDSCYEVPANDPSFIAHRLQLGEI